MSELENYLLQKQELNEAIDTLSVAAYSGDEFQIEDAKVTIVTETVEYIEAVKALKKVDTTTSASKLYVSNKQAEVKKLSFIHKARKAMRYGALPDETIIEFAVINQDGVTGLELKFQIDTPKDLIIAFDDEDPVVYDSTQVVVVTKTFPEEGDYKLKILSGSFKNIVFDNIVNPKVLSWGKMVDVEDVNQLKINEQWYRFPDQLLAVADNSVQIDAIDTFNDMPPKVNEKVAIVRDASGNNFDLVAPKYGSAPMYRSYQGRMCLEFDGFDDTLVIEEAFGNHWLTPRDGITIDFYIYENHTDLMKDVINTTNPLTYRNWVPIFGMGVAYQIHPHRTDYPRLNFYLRDSVSGLLQPHNSLGISNVYQGQTNPNLSGWQRYTCTYDQASSTFKMYRNGAHQDTEVIPGMIWDAPIYGNRLTGICHPPSTPIGTDHTKTRLSTIRVWDKALSQTEVTYFGSNQPEPGSPNLVAFW